MAKNKYRIVKAISFNPAEEDSLQVLMASGGYSNFSEFAKAKILGAASENEKRLKALEVAVETMRGSSDHFHALLMAAFKKQFPNS